MTVSSTSLKTDTSYSEMMDVLGLSEGRREVSETCLWTASSLYGTLLSYMDVSVLCIRIIVLDLHVWFATVR